VTEWVGQLPADLGTSASAIVTGMTFTIVWPTTSMTSIGKLEMTALFHWRRQGYLLALKEL
jgi:hypothetical protein